MTKIQSGILVVCAGFLAPSLLVAAPFAEPFSGDPPDAHHPWTVHDPNRPQPKIVTPGTGSTQEIAGRPPSDAIVLFDGTDMSRREADKPGHEPSKWILRDGAMECVPNSGFVRSKEEFGDCQLHIEWAAPTPVKGDSQGRGNSGIFLMGRVEIQVLDNYNNPSYADGMAGAVYGQWPPMANVLRPPGQFQCCDVVFRRPIFKGDKQIEPGYVTLFMNGVLVQDHAVIEGPTENRWRAKIAPFPDKGALTLQDHHNPVRFRNIWYRPLPPRAIEGGTDGCLTEEVTQARRHELAVSIRNDAQSIQQPVNQILRCAESLVYEKDSATLEKVQAWAGQYAASVKQMATSQLESKKEEIRKVKNAFDYLVKWDILPKNFQPKLDLDQIVKEQKWDQKKGK